jgi:hypothetical protein
VTRGEIATSVHRSRSKQKRALILVSLQADPQLSDMAHARRCGASHHTVESVRQANSEIPNSDDRVPSAQQASDLHKHREGAGGRVNSTGTGRATGSNSSISTSIGLWRNVVRGDPRGRRNAAFSETCRATSTFMTSDAYPQVRATTPTGTEPSSPDQRTCLPSRVAGLRPASMR